MKKVFEGAITLFSIGVVALIIFMILPVTKDRQDTAAEPGMIPSLDLPITEINDLPENVRALT